MEDTIVVSPDLGGVTRARDLAGLLVRLSLTLQKNVLNQASSVMN